MYGFTKEQIEEIRTRLYQGGRKDSDFPVNEKLEGGEHLAIVQNEENRKLSLDDLFQSGLFQKYFYEYEKPLDDKVRNILVSKGVVAIGDDGYWYVDGKKTEVKAEGEKGVPGEKGKDGKDAVNPILRLSDNGFDIEVSADNGETWLPLIKDFSKVRVLGYVDSMDGLPKNANVGDIYGVWDAKPTEEDPEAGVYKLYINTVKDWVEDYTIAKIYDYDTELPSSATDGTAVLVPVTDLTLDKEKVDGYKVYKYNQSVLGWVMVLNTAEIYASKDDIVNYGDNVYALVQGETAGTYELYKRQVGWVYFGTNASIAYHLIQSVEDGSETNILSGKAVKDAIEAESQASSQVVNAEIQRATDAEQAITEDLANYKEEVKDTYGDYAESPEFVRLVTDKDGRVLYGVQKDGNFYFGAGCPPQVKDYVQQQIDTIMGVDDVTEKIDTLNEMIAFFDEIRNDTTLKALLAASAQAVADEKERAEAAEQALDEAKVDKEEGKSLIDADYAEGIHYIDNPEFLEVKVDSEDRIVEATLLDGTKLLPADVKVSGVIEHDGETISTIDNPEFIGVWLDNADHILFGLRADGDVVFGCGVPFQVKNYVESHIGDSLSSINAFLEGIPTDQTLRELLDNKVDKEEGKGLIDAEYAATKSATDSPEFLEVTTDSEDKVLEGIQKDGTKVVGGDVSIGGSATVGGDVHVKGSATISGVSYQVIESPEWVWAVLDAENKVLCGIRQDGKFTADIEGADANIQEAVRQMQAIADEIQASVDEKIAAIEEKVDFISWQENPEYIEAKLDSEDRVVEAIKTDGTKVIGGSLEVSDNLEVSGNVKIAGEMSFANGIPQAIVDYVAANTGSGVTNIEYDEATGDVYATFDDTDGVTDVYMEENGDIYVVIEE